MPTRRASAVWEGGLQGGSGSFDGESGAIRGSYSAGSRFGEAGGTNPEELLAAAEAACYSMALSAGLEKAGFTPQRVRTEAACTIEKVGEGFKITTMRLRVTANVPGVDEGRFQEVANATKTGCPVSQALAGVNIEVEATLDSSGGS
ncbi:MAG TPA: OsmC family peroxiredoxin [Longimicrobium sp.]|jgi:osmotically inducible protein OsmC